MDDLVTWLREQIAEDRRIAGDLPADGVPTHDSRMLTIPVETGVLWPDRWNPVAVLAQCDAHEAILDAVQRGLDGHDGPCVNYIGQDPADYSRYDSCERHIDWAKTTLPPYAAQLVGLAYQHHPGFRAEWRHGC